MSKYGYMVGGIEVNTESLKVLKLIIVPVIALPCLVAIYAIKQMTYPTDGTEFLLFAAVVAGVAGYTANEVRNYLKIKTLKKENEACIEELKRGGTNG